MAFGQQSGPPASAKQVRDILELLQAAGHTDFRDARGPMGFTQRQAAGKFTRDEADELIGQLQSTEPSADPAVPKGVPALREVPAEQLAAELQHRGWIVVEP
jgi:hypothetical protein